MKKLLISIFAIAVSLGAFAQTNWEAKIGSKVTYSAKPATFSKYNWSTTGGSNSSFAVNTPEIAVIWDNATLGSTYDITVYAENDGCAGDNKVKRFIAVDKLSYNGTFVKGYAACPVNTKNLTSAGAFDLQITIVNGAALAITDDVTVAFTLDGVPQTAQMVKPDASGIVKINVPLDAASGTNNTSANINKNIVVTSLLIAGRDGVSIPDSERPTGVFELKFNPIILDF